MKFLITLSVLAASLFSSTAFAGNTIIIHSLFGCEETIIVQSAELRPRYRDDLFETLQAQSKCEMAQELDTRVRLANVSTIEKVGEVSSQGECVVNMDVTDDFGLKMVQLMDRFRGQVSPDTMFWADIMTISI